MTRAERGAWRRSENLHCEKCDICPCVCAKSGAYYNHSELVLFLTLFARYSDLWRAAVRVLLALRKIEGRQL